MNLPTLKLYDSNTRSLRAFVPLDATHVRMYVCGITPYDYAHIGNGATSVAFDVLFRVLRHLFGADQVVYASNFTDIDDKIITRAAETGVEPLALAQTFIDVYQSNMRQLGNLTPTHQPRVTDAGIMAGIVRHVDALIEQGYAYVTPSGDVLYRVNRFATFGALVNRQLNQQRAGARVAIDDEKENPEDFVLWKANAKSAAKLEQAFHPMELGARHFQAPGRPGWHIECSVMSEQLLFDPFHRSGDAAMFDIHGGGEDLQFPHHSCEIAQSEPLHPHMAMANYWLHRAFITVEGQRMGKSMGNYVPLPDALTMYGGPALRLWLLQTHYRKPVDYTPAALEAAAARLSRWQVLADVTPASTLPDAFLQALTEDLNTAKALAVIDQTDDLAAKRAMLDFLGIALEKAADAPLSPEAQTLLTAREHARQSKNWAESDRLRDELKTVHGVVVEDGAHGTTWRRG